MNIWDTGTRFAKMQIMFVSCWIVSFCGFASLIASFHSQLLNAAFEKKEAGVLQAQHNYWSGNLQKIVEQNGLNNTRLKVGIKVNLKM